MPRLCEISYLWVIHQIDEAIQSWQLISKGAPEPPKAAEPLLAELPGQVRDMPLERRDRRQALGGRVGAPDPADQQATKAGGRHGGDPKVMGEAFRRQARGKAQQSLHCRSLAGESLAVLHCQAHQRGDAEAGPVLLCAQGQFTELWQGLDHAAQGNWGIGVVGGCAEMEGCQAGEAGEGVENSIAQWGASTKVKHAELLQLA